MTADINFRTLPLSSVFIFSFILFFVLLYTFETGVLAALKKMTDGNRVIDQ